MEGGRPHWCVHPKCLGFETQGVYTSVADRLAKKLTKNEEKPGT